MVCSPRSAMETTVLALFPFDSSPEQMKQISAAVAQVKMTQVLPQLSKIESRHPALADTANTFKAVVISAPAATLCVVGWRHHWDRSFAAGDRHSWA